MAIRFLLKSCSACPLIIHFRIQLRHPCLCSFRRRHRHFVVERDLVRFGGTARKLVPCVATCWSHFGAEYGAVASSCNKRKNLRCRIPRAMNATRHKFPFSHRLRFASAAICDVHDCAHRFSDSHPLAQIVLLTGNKFRSCSVLLRCSPWQVTVTAPVTVGRRDAWSPVLVHFYI